MKRIACVVVLLALTVPVSADAQRRHSSGWRANPFSFTPYAGAYKDAYDLEADGSDLGWLIGFKAGYHESERTTFHLNLGYAQANDVGSRGGFNPTVLDNQWVILTAGGDFKLVPGTTSIAVGVDAGVAWRKVSVDEPDVVPTGDSSEGWGTYELVAPALVLRHQFSPRSSLSLTVQDYIMDVLEGPVEHSPALSVGLSFR